MALKQSKILQIPQRNKDLAFGYVKDCEKQNRQVIPSMIKHLCLIYFNQNKDGFDAKNTHQNIKIKGNFLEWNGADVVDHNCYLKNIVDKGIHIWKFKCDEVCVMDKIGIRNIDSEPLKSKGHFNTGHDDKTVVGYAYFLFGRITEMSSESPPTEFGQRCKDGDLIEMRLDFNNLTLSFKINDNDYGKGFDIKSAKYRAVIGLFGFTKSYKYTLMSYQYIV